MLKPFYTVIDLGLKVEFKYTSRKTARRVFSSINIKDRTVKTIKTNHRNIKARYKFKTSFCGLHARYIAAAKANRYPIKIGWVIAGNNAAEVKRPSADNRLFFSILILI